MEHGLRNLGGTASAIAPMWALALFNFGFGIADFGKSDISEIKNPKSEINLEIK
jgi:hypothetical protein